MPKKKATKKRTKTKTPSIKERSLVLIKPDAVQRGLIGEMIARFERAGLKVVALKLVKPTKEHFAAHYPEDRKYLAKLGEKAIAGFEAYDMDIKKAVGTTNKVEVGKHVKKWLLSYMTSGPVVALVVQGPHAVENVRMIIGPTMPLAAMPGTIRGDFSLDSASFANPAKRGIKNLVHASDSVKGAEEEIKLWFAAEEMHDYTRADEHIMF